MHKHTFNLHSILLVLVSHSLIFAHCALQQREIPGRYIVVLKDNVGDVEEAAAQLLRGEAEVVSYYTETFAGFLMQNAMPLEPLPKRLLSRIREDPSVRLLEQDRILVAFNLKKEPQHVSLNETIPLGVQRIRAAQRPVEGSDDLSRSGVGIAVFDTGVSHHPDLSVISGPNFIDNSGREDENGHGTALAGLIAAKNGNGGVLGVAPNTPVYSIKVLNDEGYGSWSAVIAGLDYVLKSKLHIDVITMSFGGLMEGVKSECKKKCTCATSLHTAICMTNSKGIMIVAAAGNDATELEGIVPATFPEVLVASAVADTDGRSGAEGATPLCIGGQLDDHVATFSNYSLDPAKKMLAAPGVCEITTHLNGGYTQLTGTSAAAALLSGLAAVCRSSGPCQDMESTGEVIDYLIAEAAKVAPSHGYLGDPLQQDSPQGPESGVIRNYGYMATRGLY